MAPPVVHHEHHGFLEHHHHEEGEGEEVQVFCNKCGTHLHAEANFCMICGRPRPKEVSKDGEPERKKSAVEQDLAASGGGFRREIWLFLHGEEPAPGAGGIRRYARKYEYFSVFLVVYLVLADIITSVPEVAEWSSSNKSLDTIEMVVYIVFTSEYLLRLWACMESETFASQGSIKGRLMFGKQVLMLVDFVVLSAFYIGFLVPGDADTSGFAALRMVRLFRVAALLKVERKANSFGKIFNVLKKKRNELIATLFTAVVLMVMSATTMYYIESGVPEDECADTGCFISVPASMWWSVTALTTVGYGDMTPITGMGQLLGSIVAFFGVGLFALPAGILGSGFVEEVEGDALFEEEEEADELFSELDEEKKKLENLVKTVDAIRNTVDGMTSSQKEIEEVMRKLVAEAMSETSAPRPLGGWPDSGSGPDGGLSLSSRGLPGIPIGSSKVTERDLSALQDHVGRKLDTIRRSRTGDLSNSGRQT